jgi:hypothetical protein
MTLEKSISEFIEANKNLKQQLSMDDIVQSINFISSQPVNSCICIQPGHRDCWSMRIVPFVFIWNSGNKVKIRFTRKNSKNNTILTPGSSFNELNYFPKGDILKKLQLWSKAKDCIIVSTQSLETLLELPNNFKEIEYFKCPSHLRWNSWHKLACEGRVLFKLWQ